MTDAMIYVEGAGESNQLRIRCREGFTNLLKNCGFEGRLPRIVACGGRDIAFDKFKTAIKEGNRAYVALLVDSEDPVAHIEKPWEHLKKRDKWICPAGAIDDQVFLMTTCMETWIISDRDSLRRRYKVGFQESSLPPTSKLEVRDRRDNQEKLTMLREIAPMLMHRIKDPLKRLHQLILIHSRNIFPPLNV